MKNLNKSIKVVLLLSVLYGCKTEEANVEKPNIILIVTDDQGYGDLGFHGNSIIQTPNLDDLAGRSIRFTNFHASPVCAPTRASLMTGRYSLRTGIYDTYMGGSTMATEEITLAEVLKENGFRTGLFGKWHLGDNSPYLPENQGFDQVLMHTAGGLEQPGDFFENFIRKDSSYFDPYLIENGQKVQKQGYITDILTEAAVDFMNVSNEEPFFCYLAYNAPHGPLEVPQEYLDRYDFEDYPLDDLPHESGSDERQKMKKRDIERARRVYAMMSSVDDNIGRIMKMLETTGKAENTLVIFMSDNGPEGRRFNSGLYGRKGSIYEGGTRVPSFWYFPDKKYGEARDIEKLAAHLDVMPSVLSYLDINREDIPFDGLPLFEDALEANNDRKVFFQWNRGYPPRYQNFAVHDGEYKLTGPYNSKKPLEELKLFNLSKDPYEQNDIIKENPEKAKHLLADYENWFDDVTNSPNFKSSKPIHISDKPVRLNRNDWWGTHAKNWGTMEGNGSWDLEVLKDASYDIEVNFMEKVPGHGLFRVRVGHQDLTLKNKDTTLNQVVFKDVKLTKGLFPIYAWYNEYWPGQGIYGPYDINIYPINN